MGNTRNRDHGGEDQVGNISAPPGLLLRGEMPVERVLKGVNDGVKRVLKGVNDGVKRVLKGVNDGV
jgi:hypothetical protein